MGETRERNVLTPRKPFPKASKGAFLDGTWNCECEPRLPAEHFQTKNGGKNHGRWFYTCQKPQHKRCGFFLWDDEAKKREKLVVLSNARSEPVTPSRKITIQCETPSTRSTRMEDRTITPKTEATADEFDWSSSNDDELAALGVSSHGSRPHVTAPETPRKAVRLNYNSSPSKSIRSTINGPSPADKDDVFVTAKGNGLPTPVKVRESGDFSQDVMAILHPVKLPVDVESELAALLSRQVLRVKGITKGREISREALKSKEHKIAELSERIAALEAERETHKAVIAHLKEDISHGMRKTNKS
ncbi:MAG: hypothetical protein Q9227_004189 [Pyrenula ochraceoflavens]